MFAYCNNNSVSLVDSTGTLPFGVKPMQVAINDGGGGGDSIYNPFYYDEPSRPWSTNSRSDYNKFLPTVLNVYEDTTATAEFGLIKTGLGIKKLMNGISLLLIPDPTFLTKGWGIVCVVWGTVNMFSGAITFFEYESE